MQEIVSKLREELVVSRERTARLEQAILALEGPESKLEAIKQEHFTPAGRAERIQKSLSALHVVPRRVSAAARRRMSLAQKARWAKIKAA